MSLIRELKRRNVFRVAAAYIVISWLVAQVAEFAFENFGAPDWVLKVVVMLLVLGLPIALVFAWAFELTPEGVKLEKDVDRKKSITPNTGRKLNVLTIGALLIAVAILLADRFSGPDEPDPLLTETATAALPADTAGGTPEKSIAVLPFVAMTASPDDEFFADGLSEELLNVLARIDELKVAGRTSSFYYKGKNEDLRSIAESLGVAHILEGSVRRSGKQIRVTAQLIKADDGFHLWSNTYNTEDGDVFAIQDSIAEDVAVAMKARLLGDSSPVRAASEENAEAQNLFLIARAAIAERGLQNVRRARELYAEASALDPEQPRYLAGYATAVALQFWNFRDISPDEAIYEAGNAIDAALALGEPDADTLAVAGLVEELRAVTASDPAAKERALAYYRRAVKLEPDNVLALQWLASIYLDINEPAIARENFEKVVELDPLNTLALTGLSQAYLMLGRHDDARSHLYKVQHLFPELGMAFRYLSGLEYQTGRLDRATVWGARAINLDPNPLEIYSLILSYKAFGWADEALDIAERYRQSSDGVDISRMVQAWLDRDFATTADEATKVFAITGHAEFAALSAWAHAQDEKCAASVPILERQYPSLRGEVLHYVDQSDLGNAVLLAHCYQQTNKGQDSERLLNALLTSKQLSDDAVRSVPPLRLVRIAALAVAGRIEDARAELRTLDVDRMPLAISSIALPVDELPVFEAMYDVDEFKAYATRERYRIAQQARMLASGKARDELIAEVQAAGYSFPE